MPQTVLKTWRQSNVAYYILPTTGATQCRRVIWCKVESTSRQSTSRTTHVGFFLYKLAVEQCKMTITFQMLNSINRPFLGDKNGHFLQVWHVKLVILCRQVDRLHVVRRDTVPTVNYYKPNVSNSYLRASCNRPQSDCNQTTIRLHAERRQIFIESHIEFYASIVTFYDSTCRTLHVRSKSQLLTQVAGFGDL